MAEEKTTKNIILSNRTDPEKMQRQKVTLIGEEITQESLNASLMSIQNCLNDIVRQFNALSEPKDYSLSISENPDKTLEVNITGVSKKAEEDGNGNNIENTYFKNNYMRMDEDTQTLYIQ